MHVKGIERTVKKSIASALAQARYGTTKPEIVRLPRCDRKLRINPNDPSAWKSYVANALRGHFPLPQRFWRNAINELQPDIALDIGMNYGECVFSGDYPAETTVFAFEANGTLRPYIEGSRSLHPQAEQIHLFFGAVSGEPGTARFFVHPSSAGSSLAAQRDKEEYEVLEVERVVIDDVLDTHAPAARTMVMKIDIEGAESQAFDGCQRAFDRLDRIVAFAEFSPKMMSNVGDDPEVFWDFLQHRFQVLAYDRKGTLYDLRKRALSDLRPHLKPGLEHTDLLLIHEPVGQSEWFDFVVKWAGGIRPLPA